MKFFTRELLARCGSKDDAVASAGERDWEAANDRYQKHLDAIEQQLPDHIREFNNLLLHDALVWSIARDGDKLLMVLRKNIPPRKLVILTYHLTQDPVIDCNALPAEQRLKVMDFQYDEFDLVLEEGRLIYTQSILFGNGCAMTLVFSDVRVTQAEPLYPFADGVLPATSGATSLSRSA